MTPPRRTENSIKKTAASLCLSRGCGGVVFGGMIQGGLRAAFFRFGGLGDLAVAGQRVGLDALEGLVA